MYEEVDFTKFWDFREQEAPLLRLIRVTVACSLGFRPPAPFGDCESCPNKRACRAVNQGRLAAAKWRMANKEPTLEGCPTDEELQLAQDAADQEEEEYVPLVEFVRGWKWQEGRPTDEEIQLMLDKEEAAQVEREHWFEREVHENPNRNDYPPYASGRGYGNFPKEGL